MRRQLIKRYFLTGLLIWVPLAITAWVLSLIVNSMDQSLLLPVSYTHLDVYKRQVKPLSMQRYDVRGFWSPKFPNRVSGVAAKSLRRTWPCLPGNWQP